MGSLESARMMSVKVVDCTLCGGFHRQGEGCRPDGALAGIIGVLRFVEPGNISREGYNPAGMGCE
jgi:hypothetical protein